jgi:hypothetical protein
MASADLDSRVAEEIAVAYSTHLGAPPASARVVRRDRALICFLHTEPNGRPARLAQDAFEADARSAIARLTGRAVAGVVVEREPGAGLTALVAVLGRRLGPAAAPVAGERNGSRLGSALNGLGRRAAQARRRSDELRAISKSLRRRDDPPGDCESSPGLRRRLLRGPVVRSRYGADRGRIADGKPSRRA